MEASKRRITHLIRHTCLLWDDPVRRKKITQKVNFQQDFQKCSHDIVTGGLFDE